MSIPETLHELETLLDDCGLDEGWSDWLRALELQAIAVHDVKTRHELMDLLETILIEGELVDLIEYLPDHDQHGRNPQHHLEALIRALDESLISANQATGHTSQSAIASLAGHLPATTFPRRVAHSRCA